MGFIDLLVAIRKMKPHAIFLTPYLPSWNQYCVLFPRQKSGKGRQWESGDLARATQLGSV